MPIKESLQQLMKQEGWTAEQVTNAIKKLQSCNSVYACLPIMWQELLVYMIDYNVVERASCRQGDLMWILVSEFGAEYPAISYRISPDFVIPDLKETAPRYEKGDLVATIGTGLVLTVRSDDGNQLLFEETAGVGYHQYVTKLPPRHDLPEGWEYTWKAAKIDGTQKLADDEVWLDIYGVIALSGYASKKHNNQWRHIVRKKKEETVEYVDLPIVPDAHNCILLVDDGDPETVNHCSDTFVGSPRFIAYIYADGTGSIHPRKPAPNWNPALIPTHVRMAKEAE